MTSIQANRILILAPHTDDGEFGCGASIARFVEEGKEVWYAAFSACKRSVKDGFDEDVLITEVKAATNILGISESRLRLFDYEVRTFNFHRQQILDDLIVLREEINPDLILMPSINDIHQDHKTISEEGLRAFKFSSILCYEMPWNNLNFTTSSFVKVLDANVSKKLEALGQYKSQAHRPYANEEFIRAQLRMRGVQINTRYAEAFEVLRLIID